MGLLEKLKNAFFEEEYVEVEDTKEPEKVARKVEVKELKKEKKVKPIEEKEELEIEEELEQEEKPVSYSDRDLVNANNKIAYFDDDDFEPTIRIDPIDEEKEEKRIYGESSNVVYNPINLNDMDKYNSTSHSAYGATEVKFQPTPIISPIYGILDKNYRKEEVIDKKDKPSSYVSRKNADLDSVRRKAYGSASMFFMEDEAPKEEEVEEEKTLFYDMMDESKPVVDEVTVGDAEEYFNDLGLEYNVDYKDQRYENATGRRSDLHNNLDDDFDEVIINSDEARKENADISFEELINNNESDDLNESANLEDNLFDLVDSMYEGGE